MANPFSSYITAEGIPPKLVYRWFSPTILEATPVRKVTNPESQWVIGTPGSGKTMLLRMLTFSVQREIPADQAPESAQRLNEFLGFNRKYIGVYFTCDESRIYVYGDGRLDDRTAVVALRAGLKRYSGRVPLGFHARNLSLGCGYTEPSID
jgi:hypothetical protein